MCSFYSLLQLSCIANSLINIYFVDMWSWGLIQIRILLEMNRDLGLIIHSVVIFCMVFVVSLSNNVGRSVIFIRKWISSWKHVYVKLQNSCHIIYCYQRRYPWIATSLILLLYSLSCFLQFILKYLKLYNIHL